MKKRLIRDFALLFCLGCGGAAIIGLGAFGIGRGNGNGIGEENHVLNNLAEEKKEAEPQDKEIIIKVEENKIYVGEEECTDVEDLKDRISKINAQEKKVKYVFEHEYAIKATYDEVKQMLIDLEEILGISIDYKE